MLNASATIPWPEPIVWHGVGVVHARKGRRNVQEQGILAVMVGNAVTEFGLFEGGQMTASWQLSTPERLTVDEARLQLASGLQRFAVATAADGRVAAKPCDAPQDDGGCSGAEHGVPTDVAARSATAALIPKTGFERDSLEGASVAQGVIAILGSVVPGLTDVWRDALAAETGCRPLVLGPRLKTGMAIACKNPGEVGADRVADAMAAKALVGAPAIVVHLEAATAITVVDECGALAGGIIAPGFEASGAVLAQLAARLPRVEAAPPKHKVGKTTQEAIASGIFWGEVARIDGLVAMVRQEMFGNGGAGSLDTRAEVGEPSSETSVSVLITGEGAALLAPYLRCRSQLFPHLTLQGLALCAQNALSRP